jgi:hypothetical protein
MRMMLHSPFFYLINGIAISFPALGIVRQACPVEVIRQGPKQGFGKE